MHAATEEDTSSARVRKSVFRESIGNGLKCRSKETNQERIARIKSNRGALHWLPIGCSSDLVLGSWFFVWGSLVSMLMPLFPMINSLQDSVWWPDEASVLSKAESTAVYGLLMWLGFWYTVSSYFFLRAVEHPQPPALLGNWYHFSSDELLAMWCMFWANASTVPCCAIYAAAYSGLPGPRGMQFMVATAIMSIAILINLLAVYSCYPDGIIEEEFKDREDPRQYLAPLVGKICCETCWPCGMRVKYHMANDWLIVSWTMVWGCAGCVVISLAMLFYTIDLAKHTDETPLDVYNYGTAAVDMLLFGLGSLYFAAGSYAQHKTKATEEALTEDVDVHNPLDIS